MVNYEARINYLFFIPCAMGPISILGSVLILVTLYRARELGCKITTYHRLLLGVAIFDIMLSFALTLGPLPIPEGLDFPGAHGTTASCTFQGFMFVTGMASFCYSTSLMVYYMLVVRFNLRDETITKYAEPWLHGIPLLFHISVGVAALFVDVYNPQGTICQIGAYPPGCEFEDMSTCTRGAEYNYLFGLYLMVLPQIIYTVVVLVVLMLIAVTVFQTYLNSLKYVVEGSETNITQRERMHLVITQCFLYGFFFLSITIWGTAVTSLYLAGVEYDMLGKHFWMSSTIQTMFPLQGFFYFLIHIRPRYFTLRGRNRENGRWWAFKTAIWNPVDDQKSSRIPSGSSDRKGTEDNSNVNSARSSSSHVFEAIDRASSPAIVPQNENFIFSSPDTESVDDSQIPEGAQQNAETLS